MKENFILIHQGLDPEPEILALDPADLLRGMYEAIGCDCIEIVHVTAGPLLPIGVVMVVDETFWFRVSAKANTFGSLCYGDTIMGNVILAAEGYRDGEPDLVGLNDYQLAFLRSIFVI